MMTNSGKTRKKMGLRRSVIIVLCAVLAACTGVAFGGFIAREVSPNPIYAEAAISGAGTSASPYVISGTTAEMAAGWTQAINASISGKKKVYITLGANWTATSGSFGTSTGFADGRIDIKSGSDIVLNLNGKTINRGLTSATDNGHVIKVNPTSSLEITGTGTITGGYPAAVFMLTAARLN